MDLLGLTVGPRLAFSFLGIWLYRGDCDVSTLTGSGVVDHITSLGGLLAANVLHRQMVRCVHVRKSPGSTEGRCAGIITHDALFAGLQRAGLDIDDSLGVPVHQRVTLSAKGRSRGRLIWWLPATISVRWCASNRRRLQPRYAGYVAWRRSLPT